MTYTKEYKESMQKYINSLLEKENNIMNNTENLSKSLKEQLTEEYEKFANWISESQIILNSLKNVKDAVNALKELDDAPVEILKVTDDTTTMQDVKCKYVYVETEDNSHHFHDVRIENYDDYLTIYDKNGLLKFRCQIDEIVNFTREE